MGEKKMTKTSELIHKKKNKCINVSSFTTKKRTGSRNINIFLDTVKFTGYILCKSLKWTFCGLVVNKIFMRQQARFSPAQLGFISLDYDVSAKPRPRLAYALCTYGS